MKPTERFSDRAEDYRRYRPGYPGTIIDLMRTTCAIKPGSAVADIGAGTGIFTKLLLEAGYEVTAVEPNSAMRQAAEEDHRDEPRFHSVAAPAEKTGLPDASLAAITVAQAFHWFDPEAARIEFARLLQPNGWVFIIRNDRQTDSSPFARAYEALVKTLGEAYESVAHRDQSRRDNMDPFFARGSMQTAVYENPHIMDWEALRGRFLSSSYVPAPGQPRHEELIAQLRHIFDEHAHDGQVVFDQQTEVLYGHVQN